VRPLIFIRVGRTSTLGISAISIPGPSWLGMSEGLNPVAELSAMLASSLRNRCFDAEDFFFFFPTFHSTILLTIQASRTAIFRTISTIITEIVIIDATVIRNDFSSIRLLVFCISC
jgi:hypothetical protein